MNHLGKKKPKDEPSIETYLNYGFWQAWGRVAHAPTLKRVPNSSPVVEKGS